MYVSLYVFYFERILLIIIYYVCYQMYLINLNKNYLLRFKCSFTYSIIFENNK